MRLLITLELTLLILATTFQSHNPPGWIQQSLPVNDFVNDIFFLDSLNGWVATRGSVPNDTAYLIRTTNGGTDWKIINISIRYYTKLQFLNNDTGYAAGAPGALWKTIDGGSNWVLFNSGLPYGIDDMQFINHETGWAISSDIDFGGIWKTTDGANNWIKQLSPPPLHPTLAIKAISILNKDTGWAINSSGTLKELYRTTNGGVNWNVQYTFSSSLGDVLFFNPYKGVITSNRVYSTTDGGFTWTPSQSSATGGKLSFANDSTGCAGQNFNLIARTTNQGRDWNYQSSPLFNNERVSIINDLLGWAGGSGIVKTITGGITHIDNNLSEVPTVFTLAQNYPNPFNPKTIINYELRIPGFITLKVFDIKGKEIETLINERQNDGNYSVQFEAKDLSSGIYFYKIEVTSEKGLRIQSQTKKMILIR